MNSMTKVFFVTTAQTRHKYQQRDTKGNFSEIQSQDMTSSSFPAKNKPLLASQPIRGLVFGGKKLELMFLLGFAKK